jgi:CBS-domain-containing membrane protein
MTADEIMTDEVVAIAPTVTLAQALEIMEERNVRHLPVVLHHEVVGMLSAGDLKGFGVSLVSDMETLDRLKARLAQPASTAMSADVVSVAPTADVSEIIDLLVEERLGAVPVIDEETNELVGIVSYVDVLRALRENIDA